MALTDALTDADALPETDALTGGGSHVDVDIKPLSARTPLSPAAAKVFHSQLVTILPKLRVQALALTRNRAAADDLVQDAVCNALSAQDSFIPGTNFAAWMHRILRNRPTGFTSTLASAATRRTSTTCRSRPSRPRRRTRTALR